MENSCVHMANPGKCGFFLLGMFFVLAFASWSLVTRSQETQEVVITDIDYISIQNGEGDERELNPSSFINREELLMNQIKIHLNSDGVTEEVKLQFEERIPTFLSTIRHSFIRLHLDEKGEIPTIPWLHACADPKSLLTGLGSIMSKVWSDVGGNIGILQKTYGTNPKRFSTLQEIVRYDIEKGVAQKDGSAAMAVLWLKRAYDFVAQFFDNLIKGMEPPEAASKAYEVTLAPHHGFFVKPVFYGAMKMLGSKRDFLESMALHKEDLDHPAFEKTAFEDIDEFTTALRKLLKMLDDFFNEKNLNN